MPLYTQTLQIMGAKHLFYFLSHILLCINIATAQTYWSCDNTAGNFTSNSTYSANRNLTASSLASNAAGNGGFYNASIGEGSDKVYALVLCRGYLTSEACYSCVNTKTQDLVADCPNQKQALAWGDPPCFIRFADYYFFGTLKTSPTDAGYNTGTLNSNLTEFDIVWGNLTNSVLTKASGGSSRRKYGTGEANLPPFRRIYTLMECTPDISQGDCRTCLRTNVDYYKSCCHGQQGGYVKNPSCLFRWDLYPFYDLVADAPPPSSPYPASRNAAPSPTGPAKGNGHISSRTVIVIVIVMIVFITIVAFTSTLLLRRRKSRKQEIEDKESAESLRFEFSRLRDATGGFSDANKLGEGGFGAVYKGKLPDQREIAVKRLSKNSNQGRKEFVNEVLFMAKLQHRNLVRLLGFSTQDKERLLVYEFVPQSSLDKNLFDPSKSLLLDWDKRYKIIVGIAKGILYLHEDSRLRIIHRDLKASNILLDTEMNPKISDFGMAMLFPVNITEANASRIVGTLGYMAPEYIHNGNVSIKTDVYSFGVLVLEIISGRKISLSYGEGEEFSSLVSYVWDNWRKGTALNVVDLNLRGAREIEVMRCIHVALLCVQENAANRPSMASVVLTLSSCSIAMPVPSKPAFLLHIPRMRSYQSENENIKFSNNEASLSEVAPR